MSPDLLQGKRKREEEEEEELVEPEPTREKNEEPDLEPEDLLFTGDVAEQPEQDQPLKLVKKTNTAETGNIFNLSPQ